MATIVESKDIKEQMLLACEKILGVMEPMFGPTYKNTLLDMSFVGGTGLVTNDGYMVISRMTSSDDIQKMGMKLFLEIADKTKKEAGDGAVMAILIAASLLKEGYKQLGCGVNPIQFRKGMRLACDQICADLLNRAIPLESKSMVEKLASHAVKEEEIGAMIAHAYEEVTKDGFVTLEETKARETYLEIIPGMRLLSGYLSKYMSNKKEEKKVFYEQAMVLVTDMIIDRVELILPILNKAAMEKRPLFMVVGGLTGDALSTIMLNTAQGKFQVAAAKAPGVGSFQRDCLEDLAIMTGARFVDVARHFGIKEITPEMLGLAETVLVDEKQTILTTSIHSESEKKRQEEILKNAEESKNKMDKERFRERYSKMTKGVAIIKIGAQSDLELAEKKMRIEHALHAVRSGYSQGVVIGGGAAFLQAVKGITFDQNVDEDVLAGINAIRKAVKYPFYTIIKNTGSNPAIVEEEWNQLPETYGFDAIDKNCKDLMLHEIVDPVSICITALKNAESMVGEMLTMEMGVFTKA